MLGLLHLHYMIKIVYPDIKPSIKNQNGEELIFCVIRKRWYNITPRRMGKTEFFVAFNSHTKISCLAHCSRKKITNSRGDKTV